MALNVELKPGERIIIGECVITNTNQRTRLLIDGNAPILREKDILLSEHADTPAKLIYVAVQLMYTSKDPRAQHDAYFSLISNFLKAVPTAMPVIETINTHILNGEMYKALKEAKNLIAYESDLLAAARRELGVPDSSAANDAAA